MTVNERHDMHLQFSQRQLLHLLAAHPGVVAKDLVHEGRELRAVQQALHLLHEHGYIAVTVDEHDLRVKRYALSDKGREALVR